MSPVTYVGDCQVYWTWAPLTRPDYDWIQAVCDTNVSPTTVPVREEPWAGSWIFTHGIKAEGRGSSSRHMDLLTLHVTWRKPGHGWRMWSYHIVPGPWRNAFPAQANSEGGHWRHEHRWA